MYLYTRTYAGFTFFLVWCVQRASSSSSVRMSTLLFPMVTWVISQHRRGHTRQFVCPSPRRVDLRFGTAKYIRGKQGVSRRWWVSSKAGNGWRYQNKYYYYSRPRRRETIEARWPSARLDGRTIVGGILGSLVGGPRAFHYLLSGFESHQVHTSTVTVFFLHRTGIGIDTQKAREHE